MNNMFTHLKVLPRDWIGVDSFNQITTGMQVRIP
jgi:hypothetical protein